MLKPLLLMAPVMAPVAIKPLLLMSPIALIDHVPSPSFRGLKARRRQLDLAAEAPGNAEWDRFVAAAPGSDLVQSTAWARFKRATGFEAARVISRRDDGSIVGGAYIFLRRFGPLGAVGYVARGPLLAEGAQHEIGRVLDDVERAARARRVRHLVVQPPRGGDPIAAELRRRGYTADAPDVAPSATVLLDLAPSLDAILASMSTTRRQAVRYALKRGVAVRSGDENDLEDFHRMHTATAQRQGFIPLSLPYLREQWAALRPAGAVELVVAEHGGRALAGIWLTVFGDTVTYRIAAWSGEQPKLQPNVACHWQAIRWAKAQGCRWYDLGGIARRFVEQVQAGEGQLAKDGNSVAAFKVDFGGKLVLLPAASQLTFNPIARRVVRAGLGLTGRSRIAQSFINRLRNG